MDAEQRQLLETVPRLGLKAETSAALGPSQLSDLVGASTRLAKLSFALTEPQSRREDIGQIDVRIGSLNYRNPLDISFVLLDPSMWPALGLAVNVAWNLVVDAATIAGAIFAGVSITQQPQPQVRNRPRVIQETRAELADVVEAVQPGFSQGRGDYLANRAADLVIAGKHITGAQAWDVRPPQG